ncbi:hypothetical protein N9B46_05185 [Mariniblastus sp.]|nr:hypothetical protein [Mariniblastus sp.]
MSKWPDLYRAYIKQLNNAWLSPNEGREQNCPDESIELGEVVPHMEPPSVESLEQLSEWCGIVQSAHLLPDHLRQIRDSAENLGVRVKLPVLPMDSDFLKERNQESMDRWMDRWNNIVTEFIESIEETIEKTDKKTDKKTDRGKRIPPPEVNETIRYVVDQGVEIKKGKRPKASRKALISEHLKKDESSAEVKRMARQLQPDRYGWMLKNRQQTDK